MNKKQIAPVIILKNEIYEYPIFYKSYLYSISF